ncbi:MAG: double-strand break repair protein AddB [Hyphomicrobiales bacterium]|nr:MAG: double-strand break repair protein AddB [Hyphomicrobiales bacterium]
MEGGHGSPRVFTIPPGAPFIATLVEALLAGRLVPGFDPAGDPALLADATIYLPTRRAVRAFRAELVAALGGRAAILPRIQPIGDVDEDLLLVDEGEMPDGDLAPAIPPLERRLSIARLVLYWAQMQARAVLNLDADAPVLIPASPADAARLGDALIGLMDQVANEEADWERLGDLVPETYARYWQITLSFLQIVTEAWPEFLRERDALDPAVRRNMLLDREVERLQRAPAKGPVIAAGSTGSMPATARLLAAVAGLENGAVVLPGLDSDLDEDAWDAIGMRDDPESVSSHPQYGLKQLLKTMRMSRSDVVSLAAPATPALARRRHLVAEALRPADVTDAWAGVANVGDPEVADAFADVALIEAANEEEEALAIALVLREAIAEDRRAALVTPDRMLARRVAIQLRRWDIRVDDSAGRPLADTPPAILARLVAEVALGDFAPVSLLALLKHPLARFGLEPAAIRRAARVLEVAVLRGPRPRSGSEGLKAALAASKTEVDARDGHIPRIRRRLGAADWQAASDLVDRLAAALSPLETIADHDGLVSPADLVTAHIAALHAVAAPPEDAGKSAKSELYDGPAGEALAGFLRQLLDANPNDFDIHSGEWPGLLHALMSGTPVRAGAPGDERLHIWGPLEARLQPVERIVLAGLVEGVWPQTTRSDPWLSRPMRKALGLEAPERRIGLAAHDFAQGMGSGEVVLSRTLRAGTAPTVASRWLQRLKARLGKELTETMTARGTRYLLLARDIDGPVETPLPATRPDPKPPIEARPTRLSVARIETLIRDPYAIYAQYVLGLDELDAIGAEPDMATRGTLLHDIFARFAEGWTGPFDERALDELIAIGREAFVPLEAFPDLHALWWPRFTRIAARFIDWERDSRAGFRTRHVEVDGKLALALPGGPEFTLTGRADRIDELSDDSLSIVDFKTGAPPSEAQVDTLLSPQLPLEAAMARAGGFAGIEAGRKVSELLYVELKDDASVTFAQTRGKAGAEALADRALEALTALIAAYADPERGYLSRAHPVWERRFPSPYDHLARVKEWSLGNGEDEA